jgi:hypothetical protein
MAGEISVPISRESAGAIKAVIGMELWDLLDVMSDADEYTIDAVRAAVVMQFKTPLNHPENKEKYNSAAHVILQRGQAILHKSGEYFSDVHFWNSLTALTYDAEPRSRTDWDYTLD